MSLIIWSALIAHGFAAPVDCPEGVRSMSLNHAADKILTATRSVAQDPCPDHAATGSPEEQSRLLDAIRTRSLDRMEKMLERSVTPDAAALRRNYKLMRSAMSLRGATVRVEGGSHRLRVEPRVSLEHIDGFQAVNDFSAGEREKLLAQIQARVDEANQRFPRDARAGKVLQDQLRAEGTTEYLKLVTADPMLLYLDGSGNVEDAQKLYQSNLSRGIVDVRALSTHPPTGTAVGLIYLSQSVMDEIKERPQLCGAFHELLRKAGSMRRAQLNLSYMVWPLSTVCNSVGLTFLSPARVACKAAMLLAVDYGVDQIPAADFKRQQLLYGGVPPEPPRPAMTAETRPPRED